MRTITSLLLCLMLLLICCGCSTPGNQVPSSSSTTVPEETTLETKSTEPSIESVGSANIYDAPMISISMPVVSESKAAEGSDVVIFSKRFQNVALAIDDHEVSQIITLDLLNRIDSLSKTADEVLEAAKKDYTGQEGWYNYFTSVVYEPTRIDGTLLSFYGTEDIFDGTPRSSTVNVSVTYDLYSGDEITLKGILREDYSADTLCELIIEGLADYSEDNLFENYETIISGMFSTNVPMDSWYFTETGLCFYFNAYEIAPQSMGTIRSEIPYEKLVGLMKERYFPGEEILYSGTLKAETLDLSSSDSLTGINRFAELNIGENAGQMLLRSVGSVTDVRIYSGNMGSDGKTFYKSSTVFACAGMGPDDAVVIHLGTELGANTLAVEYVSNGQTNLMLLHLNTDGTFSLSE